MSVLSVLVAAVYVLLIPLFFALFWVLIAWLRTHETTVEPREKRLSWGITSRSQQDARQE